MTELRNRMLFKNEDIAAMLNVEPRHIEYLERHTRQIPHDTWVAIYLAIMPVDFDALNVIRAWTDISKVGPQASSDEDNA